MIWSTVTRTIWGAIMSASAEIAAHSMQRKKNVLQPFRKRIGGRGLEFRAENRCFT